MKYIDLHCDTLTECFDRGLSLADCELQTNLEKLKKSECAVQCFALFTQGRGAALRFKNYLEFYREQLKIHAVKPVLCYADFEDCLSGNSFGSILTVENLGFLKDLSGLTVLHGAGVKIASLVWNYENRFAYPNLIFEDGIPAFEKREEKGLKALGRRTVEALDELKIIIDISHLSDGGADEILEGRKIPVVATHSNSSAVCNVARNLSDGQIKKIADCGGVVGVNFCKDFLGEGDTLECVYNHVGHIIDVGGENVIAIGSDFDGIPAPPNLEDCTKMPRLFEYLEKRGIKGRTLEKLCYKNFARVFKEVVG